MHVWQSAPAPLRAAGRSRAPARAGGRGNGQEIGVCNAILSLPRAKWAVFGYALWHDLVSGEKRHQIIGAADAVGGHALPAFAKGWGAAALLIE